jgi:hypothetical protein
MAINREAIEERKSGLMAELHAIGGALQDCDYWLAKLDEGENGIPLEDLIPGAVVEEVVTTEDMEITE